MSPPWFETHPRACAVVLASTRGSRLFPMTTADTPKHLLPVAGIPSIARLLDALSHSVAQIVIAVADDDDNRTLRALTTKEGDDGEAAPASLVKGPSDDDDDDDVNRCCWELKPNRKEGGRDQRLHLVALPPDTQGSIDAIRAIEATGLIHPSTRMVVVPGDLVVLNNNNGGGKDRTNDLFDALVRPASETVACTAVLVDVLEPDEHGLPLKESAKAKKGGLSRDKEDIEYIGLSFPQTTAGSTSESWLESSSRDGTSKRSLPRIILKKSQLDVEADEDMTGSTAKLVVPKSRLRGRGGGGGPERIVIRTEWSDVHVYSFAPWIRRLIVARKSRKFSSLQEDLLPLLVSRQYRGKRATFGRSAMTALESRSDAENDADDDDPAAAGGSSEELDDEPYVVAAVVLPAKTALRANTVPAYLFACKEAVANTRSAEGGGVGLRIPEGAKRNGKFQTLVGAGCAQGAKVTMKSSTVGRNCTIGDKCRLHGAVVMDGAVLGEQCSLQNTLVGAGAVVGNNCSLSDCQVGPGVSIPPFTKEKGEPFVATTTTAAPSSAAATTTTEAA
mmetsp:Transcript_25512/g.59780  ORF Transcript_25512/g.59780 Transcript_25512/m.59780 type:complete len:561 (-) Transcript_25512:410-2092(-)